MSSRYEDRNEFVISVEQEEDLLRSRGVKKLRFYSTPEFEKIAVEDYSHLYEINHIWKIGDRFYKLSFEHYGDTRYWWVIAKYNSKPTESHVALGEVISIPFPLETMIDLYRK